MNHEGAGRGEEGLGADGLGEVFFYFLGEEGVAELGGPGFLFGAGLCLI